MRLVVGLGNPGDRYRRTRHNVGFMVVDELASRAGAGKGRQEADCWVAPARIAGEEVLLVKPLTFMNRSGLAVERLLAGKGATPQDLVVVQDVVGRAADAVECLLSEGAAAAMNRFNGGRRDGAAETA